MVSFFLCARTMLMIRVCSVNIDADKNIPAGSNVINNAYSSLFLATHTHIHIISIVVKVQIFIKMNGNGAGGIEHNVRMRTKLESNTQKLDNNGTEMKRIENELQNP